MSTISKEAFKQIMGSFAAGVTVVTTVDGEGGKWGLTATAFSSVSLDPPLCLVCVDKRAGSLEALRSSRRFAVNMLGHGQEELSNHFASRSDDKFADIDDQAGEATGCPILPGALAVAECEVVDILPGGDHEIFIGQLVASSVAEGQPLIYWRGRYATLKDATS